jgi:hypothetical protein
MMVLVPPMFLSEWREFPSATCLAEKKNLVFFKSLASPAMHSFSLCKKKRLEIWHMNRSIFPMMLSIPSYEIGKWIGLRTYQHPLSPPVSSHHFKFSLKWLYDYVIQKTQNV